MSTDIISYVEMCNRENRNSLQHGMHFEIGRTYSVVLMSQAPDAPYKDEFKPDGLTLIYEGHDIPHYSWVDDPKLLDQPETTRKGSLTPNGKFHKAAQNYKSKKHDAEKVRVYEKIKPNVWVDNGVFKLTDSWVKPEEHRKVFKFQLEILTDDKTKSKKNLELDNKRIIPSKIKHEVWKRDKGKCIKCDAKEKLRFDYTIPFSNDRTPMTIDNVQILCVKHN